MSQRIEKLAESYESKASTSSESHFGLDVTDSPSSDKHVFTDRKLEEHKFDFISYLSAKLEKERAHGNKLILSCQRGITGIEPPLMRGHQIYPRMRELIANAQREVLIMGYKLHTDCDGEKDLLEGLRALSKSAKEKNRIIGVRILINKREGAAAAATLKLSNPTKPFLAGMHFENLNIQVVAHPHSYFGSFHSKMIIVDSNTAMISSCDISKDNNYRDGSSNWVDNSTVFHGKSFVAHIRDDFLQAYHSKRVMGHEKAPMPVKLKSVPEIELDTKLECTQALFISKKANGNLLNRKHLSPYAIGILEALKHAKESVNIMTPNINDEIIITELANAVERGIKVNIIMGRNKGDKAESLPCAGGTNQDAMTLLYKELEKRGCKNKHKLDVRWATDDSGETIIPDKHPQTVHARVVIIDDIVFVGSSVLDKQSIYHSRECDAIMQSKSIRDMYLKRIFLSNFYKGIKRGFEASSQISQGSFDIDDNGEKEDIELIDLPKRGSSKSDSFAASEKKIVTQEINYQSSLEILNTLLKDDRYQALWNSKTQSVTPTIQILKNEFKLSDPANFNMIKTVLETKPQKFFFTKNSKKEKIFQKIGVTPCGIELKSAKFNFENDVKKLTSHHEMFFYSLLYITQTHLQSNSIECNRRAQECFTHFNKILALSEEIGVKKYRVD